jgi:hypothetical protein
LSALSSLSRALGAELRIDLKDRDDQELPPALLAFARTPRFARETGSGNPGAVLRTLATMGALSPRPLTALDWHRLLDAVVLISRAEDPVSRAENPASAD